MAVDYYLRTARLDLDDLHDNAWMGVHTACLAGAWQCLVFGFAGVRWYDGLLSLDPLLPADWDSFSFSIHWHGARVKVTVAEGCVRLSTDGEAIHAKLGERDIVIDAEEREFAYRTRVATCCK